VSGADGKSIWSFPWKTDYGMNCADPVISGEEVFISSDAGQGAARLRIAGGKPSVVWQNKNLRTHINSTILWKGYVYGVDDTEQRTSELKCISWETGEVKWSDKGFGKGSLMMAGGKLIGLSDKGELIVFEPDPAAFKPISRAQVLGGKCWTAPVLSNGRIFCRNARGDLVCLDVSGGAVAPQ
jgi:outer membrane protein assembly factor BamB